MRLIMIELASVVPAGMTHPITLHMRWQRRLPGLLIGGALTLFCQWGLREFFCYKMPIWQFLFIMTLLSVNFLAGLVVLATCLPGALLLQLSDDGLLIFRFWKVKRLLWTAVTSIEESIEPTGKGYVRGIRLGVVGGPPAGIFIQDLYSFRRGKLLFIMRELQARASATS